MLRASVKKLRDVEKVCPVNIVAIKFIEAVALNLSQTSIKYQPVLDNCIQVHDSCINQLARKTIENFVILSFDNQKRLTGEKTMSIGTINQTAVYPREAVNDALKHHGRSVTHPPNHPIGVTKPSRGDTAFTRAIDKVQKVIEMTTHDNLIIGDTT